MELRPDDLARERRVRSRITRTAILTTPVFAAIVGSWLFFLWDRLAGPEYGSTWFLMVVITVFAVLFGVQSIAALRDLVGKPIEETGRVTRKWSKRDSFVWKSYYIRLGRRILRGDFDVVDGIRAGDNVEVRFYPHSAVITAATRLQDNEEPAAGEPVATASSEPILVDDTPRKPARPRGRAARPEF